MQLLPFFIASALLASPGQERFEGKLEPKLVKPEGAYWRGEPMPPATAEQRRKLPMRLAAEDLVWFRQLNWRGMPEPQDVAVVFRKKGQRTLLVDINGNGRFEKDEIRRLFPSDAKKGYFDVTWDFPLRPGPFRNAPIIFHTVPQPDGSMLLHFNDWFLVRGMFIIQGKEVKVAYDYYADNGSVDLQNGRLGIDADGDGRVHFGLDSLESARASEEDVVFRVGDQYFSTESLDLAHLRFVMRSHPPEDYIRIEIAKGVAIPDFSYTDMKGNQHRLSEFRGKWVLLDFWGSWCTPCVEDLPYLQALYSKYREKGFEILGMTKDDDPEDARQVLEKYGSRWTNARPDSVKELIDRRFRVGAFPTMFLLDPDGKFHSQIQFGDKKRLEEILEKELSH